MKKFFFTLVLFVISLFTVSLYAQSGQIDTTFNPYDVGSRGYGTFGSVSTTAIQTDGKILIGGYFLDYNGHRSNRIARLNPDGSIDNTFNIGSGFDYVVNCISIQSNGKILVGGNFSKYNGTESNRIIRLNPDGSIDSTFNIGIGFYKVDGIGFEVKTISIQREDKLLVGGKFTQYNGTESNYIIRLNPDGSIDNTFNIGSGFDDWVNTISIQSDGKLLFGGRFSEYNGTPSNYIIRLNTDGSIDNTFNMDGGFNSDVYCISIQSDGKILVGGFFTEYKGTLRNRIIRLNSDGSIDNSFNIGSGFDNYVNTISIQRDGKILVGGKFTQYNGTESNSIIRLNFDGTIDNTFNIGSGFYYIGNVLSYDVYSISIQNDGKILVGGGFYSYNGTSSHGIIRLNSDGSIDNSFIIGGGFDDGVNIISIQSDGKILVGGYFREYNGISSNGIIRLNSDGSIDNSFEIGSGFDINNIGNSVYTISIQSDGKLLVGGSFTKYNATLRNNIIRLNSDGSIDNTFNIGSGFDGNVKTISIQRDGKILVGGNFREYNGISSTRIIRLNPDGSIDNTFKIGSGFDYDVYSISIQSDGKILVGGRFYRASYRIIRLNSDGSSDDIFKIGSGFNSDVYCISIQSDGKILVGGFFTEYKGTLRNRIIRLNSDGSIDNTFKIGSGFDNYVNTISIQRDGKILVGGRFTEYNGQKSNRIIRLNPDGSIDNSFEIGNGFNENVRSFALQEGGRILVGGAFTNYNNTPKNRIVRLLNCFAALNNSVTVNGSVLTAAEDNATYQWIDCNNNTPINNATEKTFTPSVSGNYAVILTSTICEGLKDTSDCYTVNISGVLEESDTPFNIYPNPANQMLYLEGNTVIQKAEILDLNGRVLISQTINNTSSTFDISNLNTGVYLVKLIDTKGLIAISRVIVVRE